MLNKVMDAVKSILGDQKNGHGFDHVNRVYRLSMKFANQLDCDKDIVGLIALLHDVDDYKLFGFQQAGCLSNARKIMQDCGIENEKMEKVLSNISRLGYSKSLKGIRPTDIEGQIVSDADMCDAAGVNGIIRAYAYSMSQGAPFFDENIFPKEKDYKSYTTDTSTSICHVFEKLLKLKDMMFTEPGKKEALIRYQSMVEFLQHFFDEIDSQSWMDYLNQYLSK